MTTSKLRLYWEQYEAVIDKAKAYLVKQISQSLQTEVRHLVETLSLTDWRWDCADLGDGFCEVIFTAILQQNGSFWLASTDGEEFTVGLHDPNPNLEPLVCYLSADQIMDIPAIIDAFRKGNMSRFTKRDCILEWIGQGTND